MPEKCQNASIQLLSRLRLAFLCFIVKWGHSLFHVMDHKRGKWPRLGLYRQAWCEALRLAISLSLWRQMFEDFSGCKKAQMEGVSRSKSMGWHIHTMVEHMTIPTRFITFHAEVCLFVPVSYILKSSGTDLQRTAWRKEYKSECWHVSRIHTWAQYTFEGLLTFLMLFCILLWVWVYPHNHKITYCNTSNNPVQGH